MNKYFIPKGMNNFGLDCKTDLRTFNELLTYNCTS